MATILQHRIDNNRVSVEGGDFAVIVRFGIDF
jgi:hypothetical protein